MNIGERYASFAICPSWFQVVRPGILGGFSVDPEPLKSSMFHCPGRFSLATQIQHEVGFPFTLHVRRNDASPSFLICKTISYRQRRSCTHQER